MSAITKLVENKKFKQIEDLLCGIRAGGFTTVSKEEVKTSEYREERRMVGQLLHIKKPVESTKKIIVKRQSGEGKVARVEKSYFRLVFFRTNDDAVSVIIFGSANTDMRAMALWKSWRLGGMVLLSNPRYHGCWQGLDLFLTDFVLPVHMATPWRQVTIPMFSLFKPGRYYSFSFQVETLTVTGVTYEQSCNSNCCDARYGDQCWCLILKLPHQMVPALELTSPSFHRLRMEPFRSKALADRLLPRGVTSPADPADVDYVGVSRFITKEVSEYKGGFKLTIWSKPVLCEGDDVAHLSRGHIVSLETLGAQLKMYEKPAVQDLGAVIENPEFTGAFDGDMLDMINVGMEPPNEET